jgi:hypothetical protein
MALVQDVKKLERVETLIDIFSDNGHLITQQRKSDGYRPRSHTVPVSTNPGSFQIHVDSCGSEVDEGVMSFLETQKNEVGVFHGVWGIPK